MRMIASDYDGTLRQHPQGVTRESYDAIARWRDAGNLFGIVTGRIYSGIAAEVEKLRLPMDFLISATGAEILRPDGAPLKLFEADGAVLRDAVPFLTGGAPGYVLATHLDRAHIIAYQRPLGFEGEKKPYNGDADAWVRWEDCGCIEAFTQLTYLCETEEDATALAEPFNRRFANHLEAYQNNRWLNIVPKGLGKAEGIGWLADHLGVAHEDIITAGDNLNDLSMLLAYKGYAITSGVPEVVARVGRDVPTIDRLIDLELGAQAHTN